MARTCGKVIFKEVISNMLKMFPVDSTRKLSMIVEEMKVGKTAGLAKSVWNSSFNSTWSYGQRI